MKKNIYLVFLLLGLLTACSQKHNIHDPLPTYWQMKLKEKDHNTIDHQLQKKLDDIEKEINKLKNPDWNNYVHAIYGNIQEIRNQPVIPMETSAPDDI